MKSLSQVQAMTELKKRVRILEILGWVFAYAQSHGPNGVMVTIPQTLSICSDDSLEELLGRSHNHPIPNHLRDLNAMHEAEGSIPNSELLPAYSGNILKILHVKCHDANGMLVEPLAASDSFSHIHASASVRAIAFLMTMDE